MKSIIPRGPAAKEGQMLQGEEWNHAGNFILQCTEPWPGRYSLNPTVETLCK